LIKKIKGDDDATFRPQPQLVYFDDNYSTSAKNYTLAWKVDAFIEKEIDHEVVYVDAHTGRILFVQHATSTGCATHTHNNTVTCETSTCVGPEDGMGITRYSGTKPIVADSVGPLQYILHDDTRGRGVETYDMNGRTDVAQAEDFIDDDNFWDLRNAQLDEAAIDAHYGAEKTYDYWLEKHNWNSFDGKGTVMLNYVHWNVNWFNASWNGVFSRFGDGPGTPLTYIDIVAHEFTHGLTGNTAGLVYRNESGALNESFSDIFGSLVEFYALGDSALWTLGLPNRPFRDMSSPNAQGHPDTYGGANWFVGSGDNGGVHTNSGVQNFWFYLLVNGGSGINDNGDAYTVDSLGFERTAAIAFRNLTTYLTPSSNYLEARFGALQSASDIFGSCSYEVEQVAKAWAAVGVGSSDVVGDLHMVSATSAQSSCDLGDMEELEVTFRYNPTGCDHSIDAGEVLTLGYRINGGAAVTEALMLQGELKEGDFVNYVFQTGADLSAQGEYDINFFVSYGGDSYAANDTLRGYELKKPYAIDSNMIISVRNFSKVRDSFLTRTFDHSFVEISLRGARPGTRGVFGFEMTGQNARIRDLNLPPNEALNFVHNPEFESNLCFCVDATDWQTLIMSFDLKQTFSALFKREFGDDTPELSSSMRVTVDGTPVSEQYHPTTYLTDPWERVEVDLDDYAGQFMEVCFQAKHFINRQQDADLDTGTQGDYTYLDNIEFSGRTNVGAKDLSRIPIGLYPNPATDEMYVNIDLPQSDQLTLTILDVSGRMVKTEELEANGGVIQTRIDLHGIQKGMYTVLVSGQLYTAIEKLIIE
jgi:Zn-dependent metalloprotease